jgi:hypothetical protein
METDYNREKRDIEEVKADRSGGDVFYRLPERRKTEAVSIFGEKQHMKFVELKIYTTFVISKN